VPSRRIGCTRAGLAPLARITPRVDSRDEKIGGAAGLRSFQQVCDNCAVGRRSGDGGGPPEQTPIQGRGIYDGCRCTGNPVSGVVGVASMSSVRLPDSAKDDARGGDGVCDGEPAFCRRAARDLRTHGGSEGALLGQRTPRAYNMLRVEKMVSEVPWAEL